MKPVCMRCGLLRTELDAKWIATASAGLRPTQIDSGEDFMFSGTVLRTPTPAPCPRCADPQARVVLVGGNAASIGGYIEQYLWRR